MTDDARGRYAVPTGDFRDRYRVLLEQQRPSRRRGIVAFLAAIVDAAMSADSGVPPTDPVTGEPLLWRVTVEQRDGDERLAEYVWTTYERAVEEQRAIQEWLRAAADEQQFLSRLAELGSPNT